MTVIENPELKTIPEDSEIPTLDQMRLEAIQLLIDAPNEGIEPILGYIKTIINLYHNDEIDSINDGVSEKGTLRGLAKLALQRNIAFDPPDLSSRVNEYMQTHFAEDYEHTLRRDEEPHTD